MTDPIALHLLMTSEAATSVWNDALRLADGLSLAGVDIRLVVLGPAPDADQRAQAARVANLTVIAQGDDLDGRAVTASDIDLQGMRLAMLAAQERPDVVHLHAPAVAANARFPCPLVVGAASQVPRRGGDVGASQDASWHEGMSARGYASADMVVAPTLAAAEALQSGGLLTPVRIIAPDSRTRISDTLAIYTELAAERRRRLATA